MGEDMEGITLRFLADFWEKFSKSSGNGKNLKTLECTPGMKHESMKNVGKDFGWIYTPCLKHAALCWLFISKVPSSYFVESLFMETSDFHDASVIKRALAVSEYDYIDTSSESFLYKINVLVEIATLTKNQLN